MPFTDTEIRRSKPRKKAYRNRDSGGLYLWVTPSGGRLWRWGYVYLGREKLMIFGSYPEVSLAMARKRHGAARKLLASGTYPHGSAQSRQNRNEDCHS